MPSGTGVGLVASGGTFRKSFLTGVLVYGVFRKWKLDGTWSMIHDALREMVRKAVGKRLALSVATIDSQSVKSSEGGEMLDLKGGGKCIIGRKRHIAVDSLGLILTVIVHSACVQDYDGAKVVAFGSGERYRKL